MKRPAKNLSFSLEGRLSGYALAAGAAGVGVALTPGAEAKVVYQPLHIVLQEYEAYPLDFNHDGITDVLIKVSVHSNSQSAQDTVSAIPARGNGIDGTAHFNFYAAALTKGASIGQQQKFGGQSHGAIMEFVDESQYGSYQYGGNWVNVDHRYLGVKFEIKGKTHYGWVRGRVWATHQGPGAGAILTGYAYETVANKAIIAGKTKGPDVVTVKPRSLGALAVGTSMAGR